MAGLAYLAMPLAYNGLALGRWGALVVYAGAPWVLAILARSTGLEPFVRTVAVPAGAAAPGDGGAGGDRPGHGRRATGCSAARWPSACSRRC